VKALLRRWRDQTFSVVFRKTSQFEVAFEGEGSQGDASTKFFFAGMDSGADLCMPWLGGDTKRPEGATSDAKASDSAQGKSSASHRHIATNAPGSATGRHSEGRSAPAPLPGEGNSTSSQSKQILKNDTSSSERKNTGGATDVTQLGQVVSIVGCPKKGLDGVRRQCVAATSVRPVLCCQSVDAPVFSNDVRQCRGSVTLEEAAAHCSAIGLRICSENEIASNQQCGTGCEFDFDMVWSSTACTEESDEAANQEGAEQFDCDQQPMDWQETWQLQQKEFCCRHKGVGCYDCTPAHIGHWTADRSSLCCTLAGVGCDASGVIGASSLRAQIGRVLSDHPGVLWTFTLAALVVLGMVVLQVLRGRYQRFLNLPYEEEASDYDWMPRSARLIDTTSRSLVPLSTEIDRLHPSGRVGSI